MKFLGLAIALGLAVTQTTQLAAVDCGEGMVPIGSESICI